MNREFKKFLIAAAFTSFPMSILAYFYDWHGELIYFVAFMLGMFFQSKLWDEWIN